MTTVRYCRECKSHSGKSQDCIRLGKSISGNARACAFFAWKEIPVKNPHIQRNWLHIPDFMRPWA